tara:strand:- start:567 stop:740 length:174 start_codon:yes stop_codon:yes gene_type:complete
MSTESLIRTPNVIKTPRANISVLKQRIIEQKKRDKFKKTIIFSSIFLSLGVLSFLTY